MYSFESIFLHLKYKQMLYKQNLLSDLKVNQLKLVVNLDKVKGGLAPGGMTQASSFTRG